MTLEEFIESQEGREYHAYPDADGHSIGVGHFLTSTELATGVIELPSGLVHWESGLNNSQVDELLAKDIAKVWAEIAPLVHVQLTPQQWAVLIDFTFNEGAGNFGHSTLLKRINQGELDTDTIAAELRKWVLSGGVENAGLKNRRELEIQIWSGLKPLES